MWPVDNIFVLPGVITSLCLDTVSARMGVSRLLLPAQLPGTHRAMIDLRDAMLSTDSIGHLVKTRLFSEYQYIQHIGGITLYVLYKFANYLYTYLVTGYDSLNSVPSIRRRLSPCRRTH